MKVFNYTAKFFGTICVLMTLLGLASANRAQATGGDDNNRASNNAFVLTAERLHSDWIGEINEAGWRYKSNDDMAYAATDFNDGDWEKLSDTMLSPARLPNEG